MRRRETESSSQLWDCQTPRGAFLSSRLGSDPSPLAPQIFRSTGLELGEGGWGSQGRVFPRGYARFEGDQRAQAVSPSTGTCSATLVGDVDPYWPSSKITTKDSNLDLFFFRWKYVSSE